MFSISEFFVRIVSVANAADHVAEHRQEHVVGLVRRSFCQKVRYSQLSGRKPPSGKTLQKLPPPNSTSSAVPSAQPGTA